MDTAGWYRWFAREANGSSPQYEALADAVADDSGTVEWLRTLPPAKRQPNLLFASVRYLNGPTDDVAGFFGFLRDRADDIADLMTSHSTQTNEVARCGALVPMLADIEGELALIEVGASAGLCLFPDRYAYSYDGSIVGDSPLLIEIDAGGETRVPARLPRVAWRAGLDLNPLDVTNPDDLAWLQACIWPEHTTRRQRLDRAAMIAAADPPRIDTGDLVEATLQLIDDAPAHATKVVFHSAVLSYVREADRASFAEQMMCWIAERDDIVWLSNEAPGLVPGIPEPTHPWRRSGEATPFLLGRNGDEVLALTDGHGGWIEWTREMSAST